MQEEELFIVIIAMMVVTYIPRVLPMLISSEYYPQWLKESLEFLPSAIIAAVIIPDILLNSAESYFLHAEFITTLCCIGIALFSRSLIITVLASLVVLYILNTMIF